MTEAANATIAPDRYFGGIDHIPGGPGMFRMVLIWEKGDARWEFGICENPNLSNTVNACTAARLNARLGAATFLGAESEICDKWALHTGLLPKHALNAQGSRTAKFKYPDHINVAPIPHGEVAKAAIEAERKFIVDAKPLSELANGNPSVITDLEWKPSVADPLKMDASCEAFYRKHVLNGEQESVEPRKFNLSFATFAYGGNGTCQSILPQLGSWLAKAAYEAHQHPRIDKIFTDTLYADTPITMTRNRAVKESRAAGIDFLVMLDNDNLPDVEKDGKPFFLTSLDFLIEHYEKGPAVVMAPYCGAPPIECVFIFQWNNNESETPDLRCKLDMIKRSEASRMAGIQECAAGPTGVSIWDLRAFDLVTKPYFHYEYDDEDQSSKASTEDVVATRNISLAGLETLGYNPIFCNWDAWAGHCKPKMVGKPRMLTASQVHKSLREAVLRKEDHREQLIEVR